MDFVPFLISPYLATQPLTMLMSGLSCAHQRVSVFISSVIMIILSLVSTAFDFGLLQLHCNCTQLHLRIFAMVTLFCRFVNKSLVHTQLSSCQLTARHIDDPNILHKHTSIWVSRAEASFKNAGTMLERPDRASCVLEIILETVFESTAPRLARYATRCPAIL